MRLGTLILEIMGTILMIIGNRDMTFVRGGGGRGTAAGNIVCYDNMDQMTGYNAKLTIFGFKLNELTPKLIINKYSIKISLKVS